MYKICEIIYETDGIGESYSNHGIGSYSMEQYNDDKEQHFESISVSNNNRIFDIYKMTYYTAALDCI